MSFGLLLDDYTIGGKDLICYAHPLSVEIADYLLPAYYPIS